MMKRKWTATLIVTEHQVYEYLYSRKEIEKRLKDLCEGEGAVPYLTLEVKSIEPGEKP